MRSASFTEFAAQAWYISQNRVEIPAIALAVDGHEETGPVDNVNRAFPSITPIRETDREPYDKDVSIIDTDSPYGPAIVW